MRTFSDGKISLNIGFRNTQYLWSECMIKNKRGWNVITFVADICRARTVNKHR